MSRLLLLFLVLSGSRPVCWCLPQDWFVIKDDEAAFFHGTINGTLEVEMRLTRNNSSVRGSYVYSKEGKPLQLEGKLQERFKLTLEESTSLGIKTGKFVLDDLAGGENLDGTWRSIDGKHSYRVHLSKISLDQHRQLQEMWNDYQPIKWITIGDYYGCAVRESGAWCWGDALFMSSVEGAGPGMIAKKALPNLFVPKGISALSISDSRTCFLRAGTMKCWQNSSSSQWLLFTPTVVKGFEADVTAIGTASKYACGLVREQLRCWDGQAMNPENFVIVRSGVKGLSSGVPRCGTSVEGFTCWSLTGTSTKPGLQVKSETISGPADAQKIIASDTSNFDWGTVCWIQHGALQCSGHMLPGGTPGKSAQAPVPNQFESGVTDAAIATDHACVIKNAEVYCWGDNIYGQLGNGTTQESAAPVKVVGVPTGARQVSVAAGFSCALVGVGDVYCWGDNQFGQTGNKNSDTCNIPNGKMDAIPGPCNKKPVRVRGLP